MILTTHALTGAVIGKNIQDPWIIIALSLAIHFAMDSLRHGEYFDSRVAKVKDTAWKVLLDLSFAGSIILAFFLFSRSDTRLIINVLLGSFFSMLPDLFTLLFWKFRWKPLEKLIQFHSFCHYYSKYPKFSPQRQWTLRNAANDIFISSAAIFFLFLS